MSWSWGAPGSPRGGAGAGANSAFLLQVRRVRLDVGFPAPSGRATRCRVQLTCRFPPDAQLPPPAPPSAPVSGGRIGFAGSLGAPPPPLAGLGSGRERRFAVLPAAGVELLAPARLGCSSLGCCDYFGGFSAFPLFFKRVNDPLVAFVFPYKLPSLAGGRRGRANLVRAVYPAAQRVPRSRFLVQ